MWGINLKFTILSVWSLYGFNMGRLVGFSTVLRDFVMSYNNGIYAYEI